MKSKIISQQVFYSLLYLIIVLLVQSCGGSKKKCNCSTTYISKNDSIIKVNKENPSYVRFHLKNSLPKLESYGCESFRLNTHYSFGEFTMTSITVIKKSKEVLVESRHYLRQKRENKNDKIIIDTSYIINSKDWWNIKWLIDKNCYWTMLSFNNDQCLDGNQLLLEAYNPNSENCANRQYHAVSRHCNIPKEYMKICSYFFKIDKPQIDF